MITKDSKYKELLEKKQVNLLNKLHERYCIHQARFTKQTGIPADIKTVLDEKIWEFSCFALEISCIPSSHRIKVLLTVSEILAEPDYYIKKIDSTIDNYL